MPCPAVVELKSNLESCIPFLNGTYEDWQKVLNRLQPGRDGGFNRHDSGLALDITLYAADKVPKGGGLIKDKSIKWQNEKILGEHLVKAFVDFRESMNWTEIIYQDVIFKQDMVKENSNLYRKGSFKENFLHYTHIHIDWMDNNLKESGKVWATTVPWGDAAKTAPFGTLSGRLKEVNEKWEKGNLSSLSLGSI